jgi:hypothetical protein
LAGLPPGFALLVLVVVGFVAFLMVVFLLAICRSLSIWGFVWRRDHRDASDRQLPRVEKNIKQIPGGIP